MHRIIAFACFFLLNNSFANYYKFDFPNLLSHLKTQTFRAIIFFDLCRRESPVTENSFIEELAGSRYSFQVNQVFRHRILNSNQVVGDDALHFNSTFPIAQQTTLAQITIEVSAFSDLETVRIHMSYFDPIAHKITASADWDCTNAFALCVVGAGVDNCEVLNNLSTIPETITPTAANPAIAPPAITAPNIKTPEATTFENLGTSL